MAFTPINVGTTANDGTGDTRRAGGIKINANFVDAQAQLDGKQPLDPTLTAVAALAGAADRVPYFTGPDALSLAPLTTFSRALLAGADAAAWLAALGLDQLLYQAPAFTAFAAAAGATLEVGQGLASPQTWTWATSNGGNVQANSVSIRNHTDNVTYVAGTANDGTQATTISPALAPAAPASKTFRISATNTQAAALTRDHTIAWRRRAYWGADADPTPLASADVPALASSGLPATPAGAYTFSGSGYLYWAFAADSAAPTGFATGAFVLPLATAADDAAYSQTTNGLTHALVSVTNAYAVTTSYRVYRSQNSFVTPPAVTVS